MTVQAGSEPSQILGAYGGYLALLLGIQRSDVDVEAEAEPNGETTVTAKILPSSTSDALVAISVLRTITPTTLSEQLGYRVTHIYPPAQDIVLAILGPGVPPHPPGYFAPPAAPNLTIADHHASSQTTGEFRVTALSGGLIAGLITAGVLVCCVVVICVCVAMSYHAHASESKRLVNIHLGSAHEQHMALEHRPRRSTMFPNLASLRSIRGDRRVSISPDQERRRRESQMSMALQEHGEHRGRQSGWGSGRVRVDPNRHVELTDNI